ncbi:MAG TPA: hypothetical protein VFX61_02040 [Micromonosporaceae bacterium]|nr:hypothetical protein [Micromonosporaceae bacterium]
MSDSGRAHFWCLRHLRVEVESDACPATYLLGPYVSANEAEAELERVRERNEAWDAEDVRWAGEEVT